MNTMRRLGRAAAAAVGRAPHWFDDVESWVGIELRRRGLEPLGELELVRTRPWAAVARITTASGDVWLKEPAPALAFEPAVTEPSRGGARTSRRR